MTEEFQCNENIMEGEKGNMYKFYFGLRIKVKKGIEKKIFKKNWKVEKGEKTW